MGLLSLGTPLEWESAKEFIHHVKEHGITQFLNIWNKIKKRRLDLLIWGDEVEYVVVQMNQESKRARLSTKAQDTLLKLSELNTNSSWHPEYGRFMLEATPKSPYGSSLVDLIQVEPNMISRRELAQSLLGPDHHLLSLTNFPRLGCVDCFVPNAVATPNSGASHSLYIPDEAINVHARFPTLTANIRKRRGSKVNIQVPIYKDDNTPSPFIEPLPPCLAPTSNSCKNLSDLIPEIKKDFIYMDCMCFGMGCCCLQVTFQACSVEEARRLYDQLAVVTPIMLALSAAAPIFKGYLSDRDCRWDVISASVDDRTSDERNPNVPNYINKSRYDSISLYLSPGPMYSGGCCSAENLSEFKNEELNKHHYFKPEYNDLNPPYNPEIKQRLEQGGVDSFLAHHYAHLFIRDPLVIFKELLHQDDKTSSDHFENIQSTNWQTMRFKPPPPNSDIGWRVEFRSMEVQLTDKENAAFAIFVVLLTRTILMFDLNFYIPLSKVDDNMKRAQKRGAVLNEKFWFRKEILLPESKRALFNKGLKRMKSRKGKSSSSSLALNEPNYTEFIKPTDSSGASSTTDSLNSSTSDSLESEYELFSINEIMNGKQGFPGLIQMIRAYIALSDLENTDYELLYEYLNIISGKADGTFHTAASWIRNFVSSHPLYKSDSVVNEEITFDLCQKVSRLTGYSYLKKYVF